jgi:5-enolpyruvylshikimate-3-phosphate synthase
VAAEESLQRAEELLAKLEEARADLERLSESEDVDGAIEALTRLSALAKEVEAELQRARREAEAAP